MPTGWMNDVETLMWNIERDPFLDPTFGSVTFLDAPMDTDHLRSRLLRLVDRNPRFGQRVLTPVGRLTPPAWCDDPDFDIDHHLRRLAVPAPGGRREVLDLACALVQVPLDRDRPLWEFVILDGLADGGAALVQKVHHTITDGEGGLRIAAEILDAGPEIPDLGDTARWGPRPGRGPSPVGLARDAMVVTSRRLGTVGRRVLGGAVDLATHPTRIPSSLDGSLDTVRSLANQFTVGEGALSPLWTDRTLARRFDAVDVPLEPVHRAARALGGSVNDAFVTALTGAIGRLHDDAGRPTDELRMAMPISTRGRQGGTERGNAFVPSRLVVPVGERDLRRRFTTVHDLLERAKQDPVLGVVDEVAMVANLLPVPVVTRITRDQSRAVDFAASNVRGAPVPVWLAGARVLADYAIGPLTAAALNVTLLSYDGSCDIGIHSDLGAGVDGARLATLLAEAFDELVAQGD